MGTQLQYPNPEDVRPRLNQLITELKAELAKPNADPIGASAQFQRHFVAPGVVAKFAQGDKQTVKALARMAGIDVNAIGGYPALLSKYGSSGFKVSIGTRSIMVVPLP